MNTIYFCRPQWSRVLRCVLFPTLRRVSRGFKSRSKHGHMPMFLCVVLFCVDRGLAIVRSPIQGILLKCLNGAIV